MFDPEVDRAAGQVVSGLNLRSLEELEKKTHAMLRSGQPVDGEFWDLVLKKIHVEKAIVSDRSHLRLQLTRSQSLTRFTVSCS